LFTILQAKKSAKRFALKNYHQREDGGNMKNHSIALNVLVYSNILINLSSLFRTSFLCY